MPLLKTIGQELKVLKYRESCKDKEMSDYYLFNQQQSAVAVVVTILFNDC